MGAVGGKLLLLSNGVTLLPLLVKETSYFYSVRYLFFLVKVPLQLLVTDNLNITKSLLVTTK